ncbi:TIGR02679 family protein [Tenggerimyces flavus]|uniref:TIGR02679 family protein n=1 Tax=Tenggerimyces flavus TaxID=1708749 RepID=A0ABV7YHY6_9ACTN|nr:TIGR02679 family protein [Tenggerimyces flavus]MBM7786752.1 uncharacterized protein (TIGR02679 family) [Tenggerimyces flavus]
MTGNATDKLHRLLGGTHTEWLVERVRRRLELGQPISGAVTLVRASVEQRRAVELLLGRRPAAGASLSVSLDEVDTILRSSGAAAGGLREAVERLTGPVTDRAKEAAVSSAAWRAAYADLDQLVTERPELSEWRSRLDATGLVRRLAAEPAEAGRLLTAVTRVLRRLPASGVPIGQLAAEACDDAHALDEGRPIGTLALSAVRALAGVPDSTTADGRRDLWAAVGVHLDELSSTVLSVGLPGDGNTATGQLLRTAAAAGEPLILTFRQLHRRQDPIGTAHLVRLCENPVVLAAAADAFGPDCPAMVCVYGRPSAAVWRLLELLHAGGAEFAYHGDFDWGGVGIATSIYQRMPFTPWRYDAAAYLAARGSARLDERSLPTPWDPALSAAMTERGVRIEEEHVLGQLLEDLSP